MSLELHSWVRCYKLVGAPIKSDISAMRIYQSTVSTVSLSICRSIEWWHLMSGMMMYLYGRVFLLALIQSCDQNPTFWDHFPLIFHGSVQIVLQTRHWKIYHLISISQVFLWLCGKIHALGSFWVWMTDDVDGELSRRWSPYDLVWVMAIPSILFLGTECKELSLSHLPWLPSSAFTSAIFQRSLWVLMLVLSWTNYHPLINQEFKLLKPDNG